jgi:methyl-accepting chemotaxis protein
MIDIILSNLRTKLLVLFGTAILLILASVWYGLSSMSNVINQYAHTVEHNVQHATDIAAINVDFKIQVQEWKNTLIRGKDSKQREKYWGRFNDRAGKIQAAYKSVLSQLKPNHPAYKDLQGFATSYPPMIKAYRSGYEEFVDTGFDISVGDKAVSGIDREPSQKLTDAVEKVNKNVIEVEKSIADDASSTSTIITIQLLVAVLLGFFGFYWFISNKILKPLNEVTEVSRLIAEGDFTSEINVHSQDQIGQLASNFNLIQNDLSKMIGEIVSELGNLQDLTKRLFDSFENVKQSVENQVVTTSSVTENMNDMANIGESIGVSVSSANELISNSSEQTNKGLKMFEGNVQTSQSMLDAATSASEIIVNLKQDSDDIGSVVNVINGIAEQTNLLALNAAIEAARAGETGRGFAVVADEVRSLATKTQESIEQISRNIDKLQSAADSAVSAITEGKDKAATSVEQIKQSQQFMQEFAGVFSDISNINLQVDEAVSNQNTQSSMVHEGLSKISSLGHASQEDAKIMGEASSVLVSVLDNINQSTQRFKLKR